MYLTMHTRALNWPNFISLGRLLTVPVIIWLILTNQMTTAFWLFIVAGISDILDGLLARILKERTKVGAYLDPIADKALLMGTFISLAVQDYLPLWLVILVVFRDILIISGTLLLILFNKEFTVTPTLISKIHTLVQIVLISILLCSSIVNLPWHHQITDILIKTVAITGLLSGFNYVYIWTMTMNRD